MRKEIILTGIILLLCVPSIAKKPIKGLPKSCGIQAPYYSLKKNTEDVLAAFANKGYLQPDKPGYGYWDVYSDRNNNVTYANSSMSEPFSSLSFRERVRIAKIKKGFALVYTERDTSVVYPTISQDIEWRGWVPMEHLIYTDYSLVNKEGVNIKVLFNDDVRYIPDLVLTTELHDNPVTDSAILILPDRTNSVYYLIRREGKRSLLASNPEISQKDNIFGWIDNNEIMIWPSRIAAEPSWEIADNDYFASHDMTCAIQDSSGERIGRIVYHPRMDSQSYEIDKYRMRSGLWRFPLLEMQDSTLECAVPGDSKFLDVPTPNVPVYSANELFPTATEMRTNIFFMLDGSRVYEPYFPILADRVQAIGNQFRNSNRVRIGALIYHDARSGANKTEFCPLTNPGDSELYDFLDQGGQYGFKDNLSEAPLMSALEKVIQEAGFEENALNYLIVVGGRGDNSDSSLSPLEISNLLAAKSVTVFSLQVQNNVQAAAYRLFGYQMEEIIRLISSQRSKEFLYTTHSTEGDGILKTSFINPQSFSDVPDCLYKIETGLLDEDEFSIQLNRILEKISYVSAIGKSGAAISYYPQLFRKATLPLDNDGRKYCKQVALYEEAELDHLIALYTEFNNLFLSKESDRNLFCELLIKNLPPSFQIPEEELYSQHMREPLAEKIKRHGYRRVISIIEGLSLISGEYWGPSLADILSPKTVPQEEYMHLLESLAKRYHRLLTIRNTPSIYTTTINGAKHYWVPIEDLI